MARVKHWKRTEPDTKDINPYELLESDPKYRKKYKKVLTIPSIKSILQNVNKARKDDKMATDKINNKDGMDYEQVAVHKPQTKREKKQELKRVLREERQIGTMSRHEIVWYLIRKDLTLYLFMLLVLSNLSWILAQNRK